jgi:hypothetical protein
MNILKQRLATIIEKHYQSDVQELIENVTECVLNTQLELDGRYEMLSIIQITCLAMNAKSGIISMECFLDQVDRLAISLWDHHCKIVGIMYN